MRLLNLSFFIFLQEPPAKDQQETEADFGYKQSFFLRLLKTWNKVCNRVFVCLNILTNLKTLAVLFIVRNDVFALMIQIKDILK